MRKFIQTKSVWQITMISLLVFFATVGVVMATTTIGTNISTDGTLTVSSAVYATSTLLLDGAATFKGTVTLSAANLKVSTGYGLDTAAASGILNIGTTSATTINIGSAGATVAIRGNLTFPTAYGLDSTGAVLNIGTTTATTINIGSALATVAIKGNMTFPTAYGLDSTGELNIGTTTATTINIGRLTQTVAFKGNLTIPADYSIDSSGVLNIGTTTATRVNIGSASSPVVIANASSTLASFGSTGTTVTGLMHGTCANVTIASITASSTAIFNCAVTNMDTTWKVFVTPYITNPNIIFSSASTTVTGFQIAVYNTGVLGVINLTSHDWPWFAIK